METATRILLVDDDKDDQMLFAEALTEIHPSIKCDVANDGVEALSLIYEQPLYQIIFLDLHMPKMDGFESLKRIKSVEAYKAIPVVILSTSNSVQDIKRTKELGAIKFVTKPSKYTTLFEQLKGLLSVV